MGWDDIIIGEGNKGNSAITVFDIPGKHSISENSVSYWISDAFMGIGMTIFKDTAEGMRLQKMIEDKRKPQAILDWIAALAMKNADIKMIKQKLRERDLEQFKMGQESKAKEMRKVLGLY